MQIVTVIQAMRMNWLNLKFVQPENFRDIEPSRKNQPAKTHDKMLENTEAHVTYLDLLFKKMHHATTLYTLLCALLHSTQRSTCMQELINKVHKLYFAYILYNKLHKIHDKHALWLKHLTRNLTKNICMQGGGSKKFHTWSGGGGVTKVSPLFGGGGSKKFLGIERGFDRPPPPPYINNEHSLTSYRNALIWFVTLLQGKRNRSVRCATLNSVHTYNRA